MRRARPPVSLLLSVSLLVILAPSTPFAPSPLACPISPPVPLRMLYKRSDRVVVATVGASVVVEKEESYNTVRTLMNVTETLKGDADEYAAYVYHDVWTGDEEEAGPPAEPDDYKFGNTVLLFLSRRAEGGGYELSERRYGLKSLPEADIKVYVERIKELAALTRRGQPDDREVVEWLVRCAEHKATRWEGAYELAVSATHAAALEARQVVRANPAPTGAEAQAVAAEPPPGDYVIVGPEPATTTPADAANATKPTDAPAVAVSSDAAQTPATTEAVAASDDMTVVPVSVAPPGEAAGGQPAAPRVLNETEILSIVGTDIRSRHSALLTAEQKNRLASSLFESDDIGEGEIELARVVETFKDERLAPFLLAFLRRSPEDPPYNAGEVMSVLARLRGGDGELTALAQAIWEANAYTVMQEEDAGQRAGGGEEAEETEEAELTPEQIRQQEEAYAARLKAAEAKAARLRAEVLRKFLARFDAPAESP